MPVSASAFLNSSMMRWRSAAPLPGARGQCFSVQSNSAGLTSPVDPGVYCYDDNGTLTAAALPLGTLTLASAPAPGPRRIAIFNHKGGTGKTTTAVSIAAALAARGKRVLLVDTDAQGNVAASLGMRMEKSLYHVLVMGLSPAEAATPVRAP